MSWSNSNISSNLRFFTMQWAKQNILCMHISALRPLKKDPLITKYTRYGRGMSRLVSHWSRASPVMLAQAVSCHKEPARSLGVFCLIPAGSLWHKDAYNRTFPWESSRPMRYEPRHSSTNESGPDWVSVNVSQRVAVIVLT